MIVPNNFSAIVSKLSGSFHKVIPFDAARQRLALLDLSPANTSFSEKDYATTASLDAFIQTRMKEAGADFLTGGYNETRNMYRRSELFDQNLGKDSSLADEPRNIHLGMDIWGQADTKIFAALGGMVHSFAFNDHFGDYGATIILQHQLDMLNFYTLYGHLALKDLANVRLGQFITRGECFAHFGMHEENGNWPPHLHFQVIIAIGNFEGDYPGVCKRSEAAKYLNNCPDPDAILNLMHHVR